MGIVGSRVGDKNVRYRFLFMAFAAIAVFSVLVSWRGQLMMNSEYQEVTTHRIAKKKIVPFPAVKKTPLQQELEIP